MHLNGQSNNAYIQKDTTKYILGANTRYRTFNAYIRTPNENLKLKRSDIALGFRLRYHWLNVAVMSTLLQVNKSNKELPLLINVDLKFYPKKFFVKGNFQYASLFKNPELFKAGIPSSLRDDSKILSANLFTAYLFNGDKMSLSSAYSFVDRQTRSAGSWLVCSFFDIQRFSVNAEDARNIELFQLDNLSNINQMRIGVGGGYAYSLVYKKISMHTVLSGGFESSFINADFDGERENNDKFLFNPKIRVMSSVVYHLDSSFVGVIGEYYPDVKTMTINQFDREYWWLRLTIGKKF